MFMAEGIQNMAWVYTPNLLANASSRKAIVDRAAWRSPWTASSWACCSFNSWSWSCRFACNWSRSLSKRAPARETHMRLCYGGTVTCLGQGCGGGIPPLPGLDARWDSARSAARFSDVRSSSRACTNIAMIRQSLMTSKFSGWWRTFYQQTHLCMLLPLLQLLCLVKD